MAGGLRWKKEQFEEFRTRQAAQIPKTDAVLEELRAARRGETKGGGKVKVLAIDPGPKESAYVVFDGERVEAYGEMENGLMTIGLGNNWGQNHPNVVIEWMSGFGVPAGNDTFETCRWVGIFQQAHPGGAKLITRKKIKEHLQAVNDKFVRQALIARFGEPGKKKTPGVLYGITGHCLAALACAVVWWDQNVKP